MSGDSPPLTLESLQASLDAVRNQGHWGREFRFALRTSYGSGLERITAAPEPIVWLDEMPPDQREPEQETVLLRDVGGGETYVSADRAATAYRCIPSGPRHDHVTFTDCGELTPDSNGYRIFLEGTP